MTSPLVSTVAMWVDQGQRPTRALRHPGLPSGCAARMAPRPHPGPAETVPPSGHRGAFVPVNSRLGAPIRSFVPAAIRSFVDKGSSSYPDLPGPTHIDLCHNGHLYQWWHIVGTSARRSKRWSPPPQDHRNASGFLRQVTCSPRQRTRTSRWRPACCPGRSEPISWPCTASPGSPTTSATRPRATAWRSSTGSTTSWTAPPEAPRPTPSWCGCRPPSRTSIYPSSRSGT